MRRTAILRRGLFGGWCLHARRHEESEALTLFVSDLLLRRNGKVSFVSNLSLRRPPKFSLFSGIRSSLPAGV